MCSATQTRNNANKNAVFKAGFDSRSLSVFSLIVTPLLPPQLPLDEFGLVIGSYQAPIRWDSVQKCPTSGQESVPIRWNILSATFLQVLFFNLDVSGRRLQLCWRRSLVFKVL